MKRLTLSLNFAIIALLFSPFCSAITMTITPASQLIGIGGTTQVSVTVSGLKTAGEIVSGFDVDALFNASILNMTGINFVAAPWGGDADVFSNLNSGSGTAGADMIALQDDATLDALQGDSVLLFTLNFTGLSDGVSILNFSADPDFGRAVVGRNAQNLVIQVVGACIAVGSGDCNGGPLPIPEPATLALLALGLIPVARRYRQDHNS
jgi:PEP-CTERM motif